MNSFYISWELETRKGHMQWDCTPFQIALFISENKLDVWP